MTSGNGTVTNSAITSVGVACDYGIKCGSNSCLASTQECCDPLGGHTCVNTAMIATSCGTHLALPCDDATDCTSGVCCANEDNSNHVLSVTCQSSCNSAHDFILCDPNVPAMCSGKTCKKYTDLSNSTYTYYACQ